MCDAVEVLVGCRGALRRGVGSSGRGLGVRGDEGVGWSSMLAVVLTMVLYGDALRKVEGLRVRDAWEWETMLEWHVMGL